MTEAQKQVGRNENEARAANELVSVEGEQARLLGTESLAVLCECGDRKCHEPITMNVDEYEVVRSEPAHFAVLHGHELLDCERVVTTCEHYLVVMKHGDAGRVADADDPRNHLKTCRVVIVDDTPEIRFLLSMLLAAEPSCTVVGEAGNGAEAIELVDEVKPEVIVLDLEMPVMDGWHALPHLRRVSPSSHVIAFSSVPIDARLEKRLLNLGADRFIPKGGNPRVVMDAIRDIALAGRDRTFGEVETGGRQVEQVGEGRSRRDLD